MNDEPLGITEIADQIGERRGTVAQWVFRGQLPAHDGTIAGRKWWRKSVIDEWDKQRGQA